MMLNTIRLIFCLVLLTVVCQCNRHPKTTAANPILGEYELTGYNKSGALIFTGNIRLETIEQNRLKGRCKIVREQNAPENLPDQDGLCEAVVEGKSIQFDVAPYMADGGVLFEGELEAGTLTGVWMLDGYVGSGPLGRIQAVKRRS